MTGTVDQTSLNLVTLETVGRDCLKLHLSGLEVCSFRQLTNSKASNNEPDYSSILSTFLKRLCVRIWL